MVVSNITKIIKTNIYLFIYIYIHIIFAHTLSFKISIKFFPIN